MGFGIWSMHYVGMLAFELPARIFYDLPTVVVSLFAAISASAIALFVVSREIVSILNIAWGGIFMGSGILAMHYIGMAAMRVPAMCHYDPALLIWSGVIAVSGSMAALWLTYRFRSELSSVNVWRMLSAVVMGFAISAMHYTGMAAASFTPMTGAVDYSHAVSVSDLGITGIVIVTFLLLGFAVFSSIVDQRLEAHRVLAEELYRSRQMLQSVLDNVPQRVFWKDRQGRYLGCNRAFANDARLASPEEIVGKTDTELSWASDTDSFSTVFTSAIERSAPMLNSEFEAVNAEGQRRWLRGNSVLLRDSHQRVFAVLGAYEDITERKRAEDAIRRSNAALSEFAQVVSHDLRSPLRVAKNYAQLVALKYGSLLDTPGKDFLRFVVDSVVHMDELTQSLLEYATATEPDPDGRSEVSLESVLQRALTNLQLVITEAEAEITHESLPVVSGYPAQFMQIFQNLVSNAIKYKRPEVRPRIHVGASREGESWIVCVRDNGQGIPPESLQKIFRPLTRLHGREIPGFGIGLATCRKVVEHHGGQMWVESQVGVGSKFYFSLPIGSLNSRQSA